MQLVAPLKPLHPPGNIHHSAFSGEEWMTLTTYLNLEFLLGGAGGKGIAASANYLSIGIICGMNLILHAI